MTAPPTMRTRPAHDRRGGSWSRLHRPRDLPWSAAVVLAAFGVAGWARRWTVDDGFIVFRVVDHVLAGNGPVFNAGERVEAVTSPLWLGVLVAARAVLPVPVEWIAVVIGLLCAITGLGLAMAGAACLAPADDGGRLVPAGALLWLGLAPAWDFATSGLETGLSAAWIGACCWGLARTVTRAVSSHALLGLAVLMGLGPLVRPDFGVFSVVFVVALLLCADLDRRRMVGVVAAAAALPGVVELARMGYYASLLPTTLLAKEAGRANWSQGLRYLVDVASPYLLIVPVAVVVWLLVGRAGHYGDRGWRVARLAPPLAAVLYALAVVRGGGDFMHARLLLPALFALFAPVALIRVRNAADVGAVTVLGCWAVVAVVALRAPTQIADPAYGISDQRAFYVERAGVPNPVTLADYAAYARVTRGWRAARLAGRAQRALIVDERVQPLSSDAVPTVVYEAGAVGLPGAAAGVDVYVLDRLGLGDAYAARQRLEVRRRPGHDKPLPLAWVWGRYGVLDTVPPDGVDAARAARAAMACAPLRELDQAITQPVTARRFAANLLAAPRLTFLRYPSDPQAAVDELCDGPGG